MEIENNYAEACTALVLCALIVIGMVRLKAARATTLAMVALVLVLVLLAYSPEAILVVLAGAVCAMAGCVTRLSTDAWATINRPLTDATRIHDVCPNCVKLMTLRAAKERAAEQASCPAAPIAPHAAPVHADVVEERASGPSCTPDDDEPDCPSTSVRAHMTVYEAPTESPEQFAWTRAPPGDDASSLFTVD